MTSLASLASPLVFLQLEIISRKQTPLLYNPHGCHIIFLSPKVQIPQPLTATGHYSKAMQRKKGGHIGVIIPYCP